jgi:hypothetical protein
MTFRGPLGGRSTQQPGAVFLDLVSVSSESVVRLIGRVALLKLWTAAKGGVQSQYRISCIISSFVGNAPLTRKRNIKVTDDPATQPPPFADRIGQHVCIATQCIVSATRYATALSGACPGRTFRLKESGLTSPGGSLSLSVQSTHTLLRWKRSGSGLTNRVRTLDSATTDPVKLGKIGMTSLPP